MKPVIFENMITKQRYVCDNKNEVTYIDNVGYLTVHEPGSPRTFLLKQEILKRVDNNSRKVK